MLESATKLLKENNHLVLATSHGPQPHCSLMSYVTDDQGRQIYMLTESHSRKYSNIVSNPKVSLLVDTRAGVEPGGRVRALTVTGVYRPIPDKSVKDEMLRRLLDRHPDLSELAKRPTAEVFCVEAEAFLLLDGVSESHYMAL